MNIPTDKPILLFDGVCNLCNSSVNFVIERDPKNRFMFASLQSEVGQSLLQKNGLPTEDFQSFVLVDGDKCYTKSSAALKVAKEMPALWGMLYAFMIVPKPIRDAVYSLIAKNRYRWFGKKDECMLPAPGVREKFLG